MMLYGVQIHQGDILQKECYRWRIVMNVGFFQCMCALCIIYPIYGCLLRVAMAPGAILSDHLTLWKETLFFCPVKAADNPGLRFTKA